MGWARFFRRSHWDDERARELESYLAIETDDNIARGMTPEEARLAARRKLGSVARTREVIYDMNTILLVDTFWQDLRYGMRLLRRNPMFAAIAILSLALGTGANTAIFQLVNAIRLRTLPVVKPEELVVLRTNAPRGRAGIFDSRMPMLTNPLWEELQRRQQAFSDMLAWGTESLDLASGGVARPVEALWVSGDFFKTLGTRPALGRLLTAADDHRGCAPVAVINHAFWLRELGGSPDVIGRTVPLSGHAFEIVGVAPPGFFGLDVGRTFDVAIPICADPIIRGQESRLDRREAWFLAAMGRLKPDWTMERANAHLASISPEMLRPTISPLYNGHIRADYLAITFGVTASGNGVSSIRGTYEAPLWILLGVTGLVLLIACANLANLMMARATAREREVAVRLAIGASRRRIVRQLLSESLLLAVLGTVGGVLLAQWLSRFLVTFLNTEDNPILVDLSFDWRMFAFTAGLAGAACLLFGLAPALRVTQTAPGMAMRAGGRSHTDLHRRFGLRQALIVLQVALSLVLVVSALLFVGSLRNLLNQNIGFRPDGMVLASINLRRAGIPQDARRTVADAIATRLQREPGLDAVSDASNLLAGNRGYWDDAILIDGKLQVQQVNITMVRPGYFKTMEIAMIGGRDFDQRDRPGSPEVAIVNEAFVKAFFPNQNPIGQTFRLEGQPSDKPPREIIGVVKNSKYANIHRDFEPIVFFAMAQGPPAPNGMNLIIRSPMPTRDIIEAATRAVAEIDPTIAVQFDSMRTQIDRSLQRDRLMALVSGFFGALAALIATIGLYGVMSYIVARRRTEIGIRVALGADPRAVVWLMAREAGVLVIFGLIGGGALSLLATRATRTLLFGLEPWDPVTLALAMAGLGAVGAIASWLPARRAARLDPTVALRQE